MWFLDALVGMYYLPLLLLQLSKHFFLSLISPLGQQLEARNVVLAVASECLRNEGLHMRTLES
jgi:hypothetical protein